MVDAVDKVRPVEDTACLSPCVRIKARKAKSAFSPSTQRFECFSTSTGRTIHTEKLLPSREKLYTICNVCCAEDTEMCWVYAYGRYVGQTVHCCRLHMTGPSITNNKVLINQKGRVDCRFGTCPLILTVFSFAPALRSRISTPRFAPSLASTALSRTCRRFFWKLFHAPQSMMTIMSREIPASPSSTHHHICLVRKSEDLKSQTRCQQVLASDHRRRGFRAHASASLLNKTSSTRALPVPSFRSSYCW